MTTKLTKNDSLNAKKTELKVAVEEFEELLSNKGLWSKYLINFSISYQISNLEVIYSTWKKWALKIPPYKWVSEAFIWSETPETKYVWAEFDYAWLIWICENINK